MGIGENNGNRKSTRKRIKAFSIQKIDGEKTGSFKFMPVSVRNCAVLAPRRNALVLSTDPINGVSKRELAQLHFILRQMTLQVPVRNW